MPHFCSFSPFGKRCSGIHDYRVSNLASQSWLPHTETQGNTIATDINVDGLHQKRLHTILYDNPFGDQFKLMSEPGEENGGNTYDDLYGLVCRDATSLHGNFKKKDGWIAGSSNGLKRGRQVHSIYKLQIALKLRGTDPDWLYKYRPQHIVHDELCMVLQKRAFRVTSNDHLNQTSNKPNALRQSTSSTATSTSSVVEIALSEYNPRAVSNILVHEIAFGPDSDPSVRGLALWFNIADTDITVCTPQQAKRFRWKKTGNAQTSKRQVRSDQEENVTPDFTNNSKHSPSVFDSGFLDYFPMIRPHDDAAFRLTTEMMKHRLAYLKSERVVGMKERFDVLQKIQRQETWLKERFENQRRMWLQWAWPVNIGRAKVDYHTPVPPVEGPYELEAPSTMKTSVMGKTSDDSEVDHVTTDIRSHLGESVHRIWDTFVDTINENNPDFSNKVSRNQSDTARGYIIEVHVHLIISLTIVSFVNSCMI